MWFKPLLPDSFWQPVFHIYRGMTMNSIQISVAIVSGICFYVGSYHLLVGELYLKVVFKGKGGVSTGRLLAAVNRPH